MEKIIENVEVKTYKFDGKEKKEILKRILEENKYNLETYWDYNDKLDGEQILKILKEKEGLFEVEGDIYMDNLDYIGEEINKIIEEGLSEKEETDEELKEFLRENLGDEWSLNIKGLIKNSSVRLRLEFNTNCDFMVVDEALRGEGEYIKDVKRVFKGVFTAEEIRTELKEVVGSEYAKLILFFEVSGENILKLREEIQKGEISIRKGINGGFFNSFVGCGGMLEMKTREKMNLNVENWTREDKKEGEKYYNVAILGDNLDNYGVNKTYGLTGECWEEF